MTKRMFRAICFAALTVFLASVILIIGVLYRHFSSVGQSQLKIQTTLAAQGVTNEGMGYFHNLRIANYRMTWIDADGSVLYDSKSDLAEMENHFEREEVQEALVKGYGESRRYSATLTERTLYAAQRLDDGTILRLSITQRSVLTILLSMVPPFCMIFVFAWALSVILAVRASKRIVKPLNAINLDEPLSSEGYDELSPLLRRIARQQKQLQRKEAELLQKENELDTILGSMNEGMVLLNQKGKIISINPAAKRILDAGEDCTGADMLSLCRNLELQELLSKALQGEQGERVIRLREESYQINASPVVSGQDVKGAVLLFFRA